MSAEPMSALLIKTLPVPGKRETQTYYRSKLFVVPFTTNPLVAAAGPLLSLMERLSISPSLPEVTQIRDNIEHELRAFYSRLQHNAYPEDFYAIAYYLLAATLDEILGKSYLRLYGKAAEFQAFTPTSTDHIGPEQRFFDIVHYIKGSPHQYLDLLELAYYCLISGFEGNQHVLPTGRLALDDLIEDLFQLIQQHRVNKTHHLFKEPIKKEAPAAAKPLPIMAALGLIFGFLLTGIGISDWVLEDKAKALQLNHPIITTLSEA